jgi:hypothetical protein
LNEMGLIVPSRKESLVSAGPNWEHLQTDPT